MLALVRACACKERLLHIHEGLKRASAHISHGNDSNSKVLLQKDKLYHLHTKQANLERLRDFFILVEEGGTIFYIFDVWEGGGGI